MRTVLNPGSFDPFHLGHLDIVEQGVELFGHVTVAVMHNHEKPGGLFPVEQRVELIRASTAGAGIADRVDVTAYSGLAIDAATAVGAAFIVKGLRTAADFEIEQQMALTNHSVTGVRTVYLPCPPTVVSSAVASCARSPGTVERSPTWCPSPSPTRWPSCTRRHQPCMSERVFERANQRYGAEGSLAHQARTGDHPLNARMVRQ